jgi:hypothetical protein
MNKKQLVMLAKKHHLMPALYNVELLFSLLRRSGLEIGQSPMEVDEIEETEDKVIEFFKCYMNRKEVIKRYGC